MIISAAGMQPSGAFSILKQLTKAGKWKILDNALSLNVAHDSATVMQSITGVVPLTDLNRDRSEAKELGVKKLKSKGSELDATVVSNFANVLNVDKENIYVECVNDVDSSITCTASQVHCEHLKHNLLNNARCDRKDEIVHEAGVHHACESAGMKLCNVTKKQRKTFSLGADVLPSSAVQLPVQSDSIDVVNLIGEVADLYRGSSELSDGNTDDISTQEIEAYADKFDDFMQQHSASSSADVVVPVSQCAVQSVYSGGLDEHGQQIDVSQLSENTESILAQAPLADTTMSHSVPLSPGAPVNALQYADVRIFSLNIISESSDDHQQVCMPPATVDIGICSSSQADTSAAHSNDVVAPNVCEIKQSYSEEVLSSRVDDASNVDSNSGESGIL